MKIDKQLLIVFGILIGLLIILIISIPLYSSYKNRDVYFDYNGFEVNTLDGGFKFKIFINERQTANYVNFLSDPRVIENITLSTDVSTLKDVQELFTVITPAHNLGSEAAVAIFEVEKILDNPALFTVPVTAAFTAPSERINLTVVTCQDATPEKPVMWFKLSDTRMGMFKEQNCYLVEGQTEKDLIKIADKIGMTLLGIM